MGFLSLFLVGGAFEFATIIALFILACLFEHNDRQFFSTTFFVLLFGILYYNYRPDLQTTVYYLIGYIIIGLFWTFWRYKKFVKEKLEALAKEHPRNEKNEYIWDSRIEGLAPNNHVDAIVAWIIIWPISLIENALGDAYDMLTSIVKVHLRAVYQKILDHEIGKLNK